MSRNFELLEQIEKEFVSPAANNGRRPDRIPAGEFVAPERGAAVASDDLIQLVQSVFLPTTGKAYHQVVFCGIEKANSSSAVCAHAGQTLAANTAERVCLVDAARGSSGLSGLFGVPGHSDDGDGQEQSVQVARNLWLVSSPAATSAGILRSATELTKKLVQLRREFGFVLIDAQGCTVGPEATLLGKLSDAAILVIEADATRRAAAAKAKQDIEAAGIPLAGTVLHNRSFPIPKSLYERL